MNSYTTDSLQNLQLLSFFTIYCFQDQFIFCFLNWNMHLNTSPHLTDL